MAADRGTCWEPGTCSQRVNWPGPAHLATPQNTPGTQSYCPLACHWLHSQMQRVEEATRPVPGMSPQVWTPRL